MANLDLGKSYTKRKIFNLIKRKKYKISDERTMTDIDSPTGRVFIGVAKKPLQKIVKGFGFKGVLLQSDNRVFIQCHICGKWVRTINTAHLKKHNTTKEAYCKKFGLFKHTALVSDEMSYSLEERGRKNIESYNNLSSEKAAASRAKALEIRREQRVKMSDTVEHQNRYAICEKQLGYRLIEHIKKYRSLPNRSGKNEGNLIAKAMHRRYGSLNEGFKHYGVPTIYRIGSSVELCAPNKKQLFYNYNKHWNREKVYIWMIQQCPKLHPEAINEFAQ